jgi:hypothetical protein
MKSDRGLIRGLLVSRSWDDLRQARNGNGRGARLPCSPFELLLRWNADQISGERAGKCNVAARAKSST